MTTKLEQFSKDVMGVTLSPYQIKIAIAMVNNRPLAKIPAYNRTTTRNIVMAYMKDSIKEIEE